jgi:hypothetical protein
MYVLWILNQEGIYLFYKMYQKDLTPDQWKVVTSPLKMIRSLCYFRERETGNLTWLYEKLDELVSEFRPMHELVIEPEEPEGNIVRSQIISWII